MHISARGVPCREITSAKGLRWEYAWCVQGIEGGQCSRLHWQKSQGRAGLSANLGIGAVRSLVTRSVLVKEGVQKSSGKSYGNGEEVTMLYADRNAR